MLSRVQEHSPVRDADGLHPGHAVEKVPLDVSHSASERQPAELRQTVRRTALTQPIERSPAALFQFIFIF